MTFIIVLLLVVVLLRFKSRLRSLQLLPSTLKHFLWDLDQLDLALNTKDLGKVPTGGPGLKKKF